MKATIYLDSNELPKVEFQQGAVTRKVTVDMHDLMESVFNAFHEVEDDTAPEYEPPEKELLISSALPMNTVKYGKYDGGTEMIALAYPAEQHDVAYHSSKFSKVGFPNLLFVFSLKEGRLKSKSVYCYKDTFIRNETELYAYPYANVFAGGSMCFYLPGDNDIKDLVQLQTLPHIWRNTTMNDHLYDPKRTSLNVSLRELLQTFENKPFNHEILEKKVLTFEKIK